MVSCLPDKRAPGGAPFLVPGVCWRSYVWGEIKAVAEEMVERGLGRDAARHRRKKEKQVIPVVQGSGPASKPRQQDVAGNRVID